MRRILEVKERYKYQLLRIPGVVSVGIGIKSVNKVNTDHLAIFFTFYTGRPFAYFALSDNLI